MTKREKINARLAELQEAANEIAALKNELETTDPALLDFDEDAAVKAEIERKNEFLRREGLLP